MTLEPDCCVRSPSDLKKQFAVIHPVQEHPIGQQHGAAEQQRLECGSENLECSFAQVDAERAGDEIFE